MTTTSDPTSLEHWLGDPSVTALPTPLQRAEAKRRRDAAMRTGGARPDVQVDHRGHVIDDRPPAA